MGTPGEYAHLMGMKRDGRRLHHKTLATIRQMAVERACEEEGKKGKGSDHI